jgi:hypothetical protein
MDITVNILKLTVMYNILTCDLCLKNSRFKKKENKRRKKERKKFLYHVENRQL